MSSSDQHLASMATTGNKDTVRMLQFMFLS
jgi:hypothetical protein